MLKELGLARRHSDTFEPLPDVLRAVLLTECGVAPERLPHLTGPQIETILREHAGALGLVSEPPATQPPEVGHSADFHEAVGSPAEPDDLVTFTVALGLFHVSRPTLQRGVTDGRIPSFRKGEKGPHLVRQSDLDRLFTRRK